MAYQAAAVGSVVKGACLLCVVVVFVLLSIRMPLAQVLDHTEAQEKDVTRLTYDYFAARDGRNYQKAYALLTPSDQKEVPYGEWVRLIDQFNEQAGTVTSRLIVRMTWYLDPPNVAAGLYCAVDFVGTFKKIDRLSGYLVFHLEPDGRFLIVREEQNYIGERIAPIRLPET